MPSHLRELHEQGKLPKGLPEGVTWFDVDANDIADHYAGEAAKAAQLHRGVTYQLIRYMYLIIKIQKGWLQSYQIFLKGRLEKLLNLTLFLE